MSLDNMRAQGVHHVVALCRACGHSAEVNIDKLDGAIGVPEVAARMVCSACQSRKIETRPAWHLTVKPAQGT